MCVSNRELLKIWSWACRSRKPLEMQHLFWYWNWLFVLRLPMLAPKMKPFGWPNETNRPLRALWLRYRSPSGLPLCSPMNAQAPYPARPIDRRSIYAADRAVIFDHSCGRAIPHKAPKGQECFIWLKFGPFGGRLLLSRRMSDRKTVLHLLMFWSAQFKSK